MSSTCVESGRDPGSRSARSARRRDRGWERLDAHPPAAVVVLKPDHVRDVDLFVRRYGARAFGPDRFDRHDIPETDLEPIYPGSRLPEASSPSTTDGAATRRRSGYPSSEPSSSPTR
jgi:hypothetical protein